jgi:Domain of unknown function (DUF1707)
VNDLDVRVGDDERQATVERLAQHFRTGRLSADELEERTAAANAAVTRGDLVKLEADLPAAPDTRPDPPAVDRAKRIRERAVSVAAISVFLWIIWAVTGAGFPWPIFPMAAMVLGFVLDTWGGREERDQRRHDRLPRPPRPPRLR